MYFQSILHVRRAVVWLVHAVSSQQVSVEGFVSNGGYEEGGEGKCVYNNVYNNKSCT